MRYVNGAVYHAARGFLHHLIEESPDCTRIDEELVSCWNLEEKSIASGTFRRPLWVRNIWEKPFLLEFDSISQAAKALKNIQRNWSSCPTRLHRRTALIRESLPPIQPKPKQFPFPLPKSPMGAFTLLDEHLLLGSAECSSPFANGEFSFIEDAYGPPSRAYRKLWEALLLAQKLPQPGQTCLDAGASPGGWTWALAGLGAKVISVDRAVLDERVSSLSGVSFIKHDAFTLKPEDIGPVEWVFSDVICYPAALYSWVEKWLSSGLAKNFICTIKMQGDHFDRETTAQFSAIPGSKVLHLWHNKHELTWILTQPNPT